MSTKRNTAQIVNDVDSVSPIRTIQDMWDATIEYHKQGLYDTEAMPLIRDRMDPRLTYQDVSDVFSGVYADYYWANTYMSSAYLSKSLVQGLGITQSAANIYASNSIAQWRGLIIRKNTSDVGQIPTQGVYYSSIDIVCNQNTPIPTNDLIKNWNSQFWQTPQVGKNFIYARCANNNFMGDINPSVQMYYTNGGFNQPPSSWIQCLTYKDSAQNGKVMLLNGDSGPMGLDTRGASEAFIMELYSADHICVISAICTEYFTKNKPKTIPQGNWDSYTYITHNCSSAWHNFDPQQNVETKLDFYNQDGTPEDFIFSAECRNVPVGAKIRLKSNDPKVPFDSGLIEVNNPGQRIEQHVTLPANYKGQLVVTMSDNGDVLPANTAVEIQMFWRLRKGHKNYRNAANTLSVESLMGDQDVMLSMGSYTIIGGKE